MKDVNKFVVGGVLAVVCCFILFCSFGYVPAGNVGVVTTFGEISNITYSPGAHFLNPFSVINLINTRVLTASTQSEAASKDLQIVDTAITLNYNISATDLKAFYSAIGNSPDNLQNSIIQPAMSETFKAVVAEFTAEDLINKRDEVSSGIAKLLAAKLAKYNLTVDSISVTNFKFSEAFNVAIEAKVTAQQNVLKASNDLQRIKIEAQQKVVQAQAIASSMALQKQIVTPELIQLKQIENEKAAIDKWNGVLPLYTGNNLPFIMKGGN